MGEGPEDIENSNNLNQQQFQLTELGKWIERELTELGKWIERDAKRIFLQTLATIDGKA